MFLDFFLHLSTTALIASRRSVAPELESVASLALLLDIKLLEASELWGYAALAIADSTCFSNWEEVMTQSPSHTRLNAIASCCTVSLMPLGIFTRKFLRILI